MCARRIPLRDIYITETKLRKPSTSQSDCRRTISVYSRARPSVLCSGKPMPQILISLLSTYIDETSAARCASSVHRRFQEGSARLRRACVRKKPSVIFFFFSFFAKGNVPLRARARARALVFAI